MFILLIFKNIAKLKIKTKKNIFPLTHNYDYNIYDYKLFILCI